MRKGITLGITFSTCLIGLPLLAWSHGGGLDANGCHHNTGTGMYECHQGTHANTVFASKEEMEKGAVGRSLEKADVKPESTRKAKDQEATEKADKKKARATEKAEKEKGKADQKVEEVKADTEKSKAEAKAEAKAEKKKAKAEEKASKKKAKAEEMAAKEKAKAEKTGR